MTNGDGQNNQPGGDWQASSQSGDADQPDYQKGVEGFESPTRPEETGHPLANNNFDVNAFIDVVKLVANRMKGSPVLVALIGLALISPLWSFVTGGLQFTAYMVTGSAGSGVIGMLAGIAGIFLYPLLLVAGVLQNTLYRQSSQLAFDGAIDHQDPIALLKSNFDLLGQMVVAMLIISVAVTAGMGCCIIPGLVAGFFLNQAPYLVAVHEMDAIDALKESVERVKKHWHVVAMGVGMLFAVFAVAGVILGCGQTIVAFIEPVNYLVYPVLQGLGAAVMPAVSIVVLTAVCTTIDELEGINTIQK